MDVRERAVGAVLGSAVGDALGAPLEFGGWRGMALSWVPLPGFDGRILGHGELCALAERLTGLDGDRSLVMTDEN